MTGVYQERGLVSVCLCDRPQGEPFTVGVRAGEVKGWRPKGGALLSLIPLNTIRHFLAPLQALVSVAAQSE